MTNCTVWSLEVLAGSKGLSTEDLQSAHTKLGSRYYGPHGVSAPPRVQILGNIEISYLRSFTETESKRIIRELCRNNVVCFIVSRNLKIPEFFLISAEEKGIPLLRTKLVTSIFIERISKLLEEKLAPSTTVHGVLMDILGVGALIMGRPGIGKSENALELIMRGASSGCR